MTGRLEPESRLRERVIAIGEVEFLFRPKRDVGERRDDLLVEQILALRERVPVDEAVAVVEHRGEIEVQRVGIELIHGDADALDPQVAERGRRHADDAVTLRIGRLIPVPPHQLERVGRSRLELLHRCVVRVVRRHADDVGVQHHLEPEGMRCRDEARGTGRRRVVGIVDVVVGQAPVDQVEERLRRVDPGCERCQHCGVQPANRDHVADVRHPGMRCVRHGRMSRDHPVAERRRGHAPVAGKRFQPPLVDGDRRRRRPGRGCLGIDGDVERRVAARALLQRLEQELVVGGVKQQAAEPGFVDGHLCLPRTAVVDVGADAEVGRIERHTRGRRDDPPSTGEIQAGHGPRRAADAA